MKARLLLIMLLLALPFAAQAERSKRFPGYEVHYNVVRSDFLTPAVAKSYGINRSKTRGLLTVSVLKLDGKGSVAVASALTATAVNLNAQLSAIDMREVREGKAIYYIGEFRISPPETLKFTINARPQPATPLTVEFSQPFFE